MVDEDRIIKKLKSAIHSRILNPLASISELIQKTFNHYYSSSS